MRKLFTLTLAAAAVMSVSAQQKAPSLANLQKVAGPSIEAKAAQATPVHNLGHGNHKFHTIEKANVVTGHASRGNDAIYEAPGTDQLYSVVSKGFFPSLLGGIYFYESTGYTSISMDGDDVYIKNPLITATLGTYIKGTKEGNKITVELPQAFGSDRYEYPEDGIDYANDYTITKLERYPETYIDDETGEEVESFWYREVTENNFVTFTINEDGTIVMDPLCEELYGEDGYPNMIMGLTDTYTDYLTDEIIDEGWMGYGDCEQTYTVDNTLDNVITLPEGIEMDPNWILTSSDLMDEANFFVSVGFDSDYIYIQGLSQYMPEAVIRGKYNEETDQYVFPGSQVLGLNEDYGYMFYWITTPYLEYDEDGYPVNFELIDAVFNIDQRTNRIVSAQEQIWWENVGDEDIFYAYAYAKPMLRYQDPDEQNANPLNPEYLGYYDYTSYDGSVGLIWNLPTSNVFGAVMNSEEEYLNLYVNGEKFIFYDDEYGLGEDVTDIPLNIITNDLYILPDYAEIYVYREGIETVGMQLFIKGTDDQVYASDLVTYSIDGELLSTSGIENIANENKVVTSEYFNLSGVRVANPTTGIYVKRNIMNDGTVKVQKVAIR